MTTALRVLLVDDCRDVVDTLAFLLRHWGHDVQVAYDAPSALSLAASYRPQLVLLDLAMPKVDGFQLARQLREQEGLEKVVLVAVTGLADEPYRRQGEAAGLDGYLVKPVEADVLERLLGAVCQGRHPSATPDGGKPDPGDLVLPPAQGKGGPSSESPPPAQP
jgi:DNA-binding response OmpR family regulator